MTDKYSKDMTAAELLRLADSHPCSMCHLVMAGDESCATTGCVSWAYRLADKIDAELAQARKSGFDDFKLADWYYSADANGWPKPRDDESLHEYVDRCFLPRPRFEDGEPVQFGELVNSNLVGAVKVSAIEFTEDGTYVKDEPDGDWSTSLEVTTNRLKRPAPEALGADSLPIKEGETVWLTDEMAHWAGVGALNSDGKCGLIGVGGRDPLKVGSVNHPRSGTVRFANAYSPWCPASWLTHTPPDTQQKIDDDATMPPAEYCAVRGIDLGDDPDRESATEAMVRDLLRRQRELDKRTGGDA